MRKEVYKVLVLGTSGVGKTSILNRFINNSFSEVMPSTLGYDVVKRNIKVADKELTLELWDSSGQAQYSDLIQLEYRHAAAYILVYDITNKASFVALESYISGIKEHSRTAVVAVVGNKHDLEAREQVHLEQEKIFADSQRALSFRTSAKLGTGIADIFQAIGTALCHDETAPRGNRVGSIRVTVRDSLKLKKKAGCC